MLIFQIKKIFSSEKWFNYVVIFFLFVLKMPKIWVGRTTLNGDNLCSRCKEINGCKKNAQERTGAHEGDTQAETERKNRMASAIVRKRVRPRITGKGTEIEKPGKVT